MSLDNKVIKDFVAAVNKKEETKTPTILTGTVHRQGGTILVQIDGSESLTPVATVINAEDGERVTLTIENHKAMITGNLSSPAARGSEVENLKVVVADKVSTAELSAVTAKVGTIEGDVADFKETTTEKLTAQEASIKKLDGDVADFKETTTEKLTANEASIKKIDGDVADFKKTTTDSLEANSAAIGNLDTTFANFKDATTEKFKANDADIENLKTGKISAEDADLRYANIDFSNIGKTAMEYFYAQSGLVKDVTIGDATITGELVGVTISGDLIKGNTIVAEKLVIKGSDGLYYKLNTDGMSVEKEQTDYNSLNGQIIRAKSITATKIDVEDLVAFGATIGGFKISQNSIYSGVKESVGNTTRGIYMDNDGQFVFGDANQYVKFYRVSEGKYKLAIAVEDLYIGSANVADAIGDAKEAADNAASVASSAKSTAESASSTASTAKTTADAAKTAADTANKKVTDLTTRVTAAETSIKTNNEEIELRAKKVEVTEAINNIDIGGRNLLANTSVASSFSSSYNSTSTGFSAIDLYGTIGCNAQKKSGKTLSDLGLSVGDTYTVSFDYTVTQYNSNTMVCGTYIVEARLNGTYVYGIAGKTVMNTSGHVTCTFEITKETQLGVNNLCVRIDNTTGTFTMSNAKLEKGNKPTDWTPAPEDYYTKTETDASIKVLSDKIASTVETTDDLGSRMTKVEQDSGSWSVTLETANAAKTAADNASKNASDAVSTANNTVKSTTEQFYKSTSPTSLSGGSWSNSQPTWENGKYIWKRTYVVKNNGNTEYQPSANGVCITGSTGATGTSVTISSKSVTYQASSSGTTTPTGTWSTSIPSVSNGQYLWTKTTVTYSDGNKTEAYSVSYKGINGTNGTSVTVSQTETTYQVSSSGTTVPTGTWSASIPTYNQGQYLWTKTYVKYSDGKSTTSYSVAYKGVDGESDIKCYHMTGGSNAKVWSKLGTLVSKGDNSNFVINVYSGDGYNGQSRQNSKAEIVIKDGWQSSTSATTAFGVSVTRQNCEGLLVQVRATAHNTCDVWVYLPWTYSWGDYTISGYYTSWTPSNITSSTAPTTGTAQEIAYRMNAENAAKTATNYMKFDSTGLTVGDHTASTLGRNVNIDSTSVNIRNATTVLASFAENLIELGKNTNTATISFLGGTAKLIGEKQTIEGTTFYDTYLLSDNMMTLGTGSTDPSSDKINALVSMNGMSGEREVLASVTDTNGHSTLTLDDSSASLYSDGNEGYSSVDVICTDKTTQVELHTNGSNGNRTLYHYSDNIQYFSGSTLLAKYNGTTPCLWDGGNTMHASQTITLSAPISEQPHGIIVIFALYNLTTQGVTNVMTNPFFIPKSAINYDYIFTMSWEKAWKMGTKRVTIQDTRIIGNDQNKSEAFTAGCGITSDPRYFVLRRVYGV